MESDKLQYDAALGGDIKLPNIINAPDFAAARFSEIKSLVYSIRNPTKNKLIHQLMPNKLRRRAMTQNPKRLPRRYRLAHNKQMNKGGQPIKKKRPSRKYRRRPSNLMREYARRMRKHVWLETHIWHAKRFHMREIWGYKIPWTPCDRASRAAYRAIANHCLLQDISYYGCIELKGYFNILKQGLQRLCSQECGLTITANAFIRGNREGNVELFNADCYPFQAIGRVSFIWKPETVENIERTLWIWVHPTFYTEVIKELLVVFDLLKIEDQLVENEEIPDDSIQINLRKNVEPMMESDEIPDDSIENVLETESKKERKTREKNKDRMAFMSKNNVFHRNSRYFNTSTEVRLTELKDTLNRFRLTGPLSHAVLYNALKPYDYDIYKESTTWFQNWILQEKSHRTIHQDQCNYWEELHQVSSPSELDSGIILSLNVMDPRLNRAAKRTKARPMLDTDFVISGPPSQAPENLSCSPMWDESLRNNLLKEMMTTHEINLKRSKEVQVPGETAEFESFLQPVPVLIIQRPGNQNSEWKKIGFNSGYDIIVPGGYGISVWLNLVKVGAKPAGVQDIVALHKELGCDEFKPDTISGVKEADRIQRELIIKYFRKPSNRRINYTKLSIAKPFKCPWKQLLTDWGSEDNQFQVIRNKETLIKLDQVIKRRFNIHSAQLSSNMLIPVKLTLLTHGNPGDFSLICIPTKDDQRENICKIKMNDNNPVFTEPLKKDPNEQTRKQCRIEHKKILKRLRNRRVRKKKRQQLTSDVPVRIEKANTGMMCAQQLRRMCQLWLPDNFSSIRSQCSRETIGYITASTFTLSEGKVTAVGYIAAKGFEKLIKSVTKGKLICLVRGTKTRHYRFASISINTD